MASGGVKLNYVKIYADDHGETHFKDEELPMAFLDYAPPAPPLWVGPQGKATGVTVCGFPPAWYGDLHPAPKVEWIMLMTATIDVEVSDGEKRTARPARKVQLSISITSEAKGTSAAT